MGLYTADVHRLNLLLGPTNGFHYNESEECYYLFIFMTLRSGFLIEISLLPFFVPCKEDFFSY